MKPEKLKQLMDGLASAVAIAKGRKIPHAESVKHLHKKSVDEAAARKRAEAALYDMACECGERGVRIRRAERTIDALVQPKPRKQKIAPRDYSKPAPTRAEWTICETLMLGLQAKAKGITPYAIQHAMPEKWMGHPHLKKYRRPADSTFRDLAREVVSTGRIRRAHPKKDHVRIY